MDLLHAAVYSYCLAYSRIHVERVLLKKELEENSFFSSYALIYL